MPAESRAQPASAESAEKLATISTSQRLWDAAYDALAQNDDTTKLVESYLKTLTKVLEAGSGADVSVELNDPSKRQAHMRRLVEEGQEKISSSSRIVQGLGDVAQFVLSAKPMIDLAIQNVPQAALPWAGVCIGLQVSIRASINGSATGTWPFG